MTQIILSINQKICISFKKQYFEKDKNILDHDLTLEIIWIYKFYGL